MNAEHYVDESPDDEVILAVNNMDDERLSANDPFEAVSQMEELLGHPIAVH